MTRFKVRGADKSTGRDVEKFYDAASREEARQHAKAHGILVESIDVVPTPKPSAAPLIIIDDPPAEDETIVMMPAVSLSPSPAPALDPIDYRTPSTPSAAVPTYAGLAIAGRVISVFAVLYYVVAVILIGSLVWAFLNSTVGFRLGLQDSAMMLIFPLSVAMVGGLLHGASTACFALRDIARNSWR